MKQKQQYIDMGIRILERRSALGLSRAELAKKLQISEAQLASIENGTAQPTLEKFLCLCQELCVSPNYLLLGLSQAEGPVQSPKKP